MNFVNKVLKVVDKLALKIHKKIVGQEEYITVVFTGNTKKNLESVNNIYRKHEIIVEIPEKYFNISTTEEEYFNIKCKFKVGDGHTRYNDLPYRYGTIPAACIVLI